jgi:hypothetical protein
LQSSLPEQHVILHDTVIIPNVALGIQPLGVSVAVTYTPSGRHAHHANYVIISMTVSDRLRKACQVVDRSLV